MLSILNKIDTIVGKKEPSRPQKVKHIQTEKDKRISEFIKSYTQSGEPV